MIRNINGEKESFQNKLKEGVFLCWDVNTVQGAFVVAENQNNRAQIHCVPGPKPWPMSDKKETWRIEKEPNGPGMIWISNKGNVRWKSPEDKIVTFEEREQPDAADRLDEVIQETETRQDKNWRNFHQGLILDDEETTEMKRVRTAEEPQEQEEGQQEQEAPDAETKEASNDEAEEAPDAEMPEAPNIEIHDDPGIDIPPDTGHIDLEVPVPPAPPPRAPPPLSEDEEMDEVTGNGELETRAPEVESSHPGVGGSQLGW